MPESCHYLTALHALSHPCLVSFLFIPSLYSTFFNSKNFLFTCLIFVHMRNSLYGRKQNKNKQKRQTKTQEDERTREKKEIKRTRKQNKKTKKKQKTTLSNHTINRWCITVKNCKFCPHRTPNPISTHACSVFTELKEPVPHKLNMQPSRILVHLFPSSSITQDTKININTEK